MRVVLVQCTSAKRDEAAMARDLYDESQYFEKQRAYAEAVADEWFIQSAKYGLLAPTMRVEPYDQRPSDIDDVDAWAGEIASLLAEEASAGATVEVLGGKNYADPVTPALERHGFDVIEPLRGLGIGERMAKLDKMCNHKLEV